MRGMLIAGIAALASLPALAADAPEPVRHPELDAIAAAMSPKSLREFDAALVGFGTRHTLSDTKSKSRGIGAARQWVKAQFERFSAACGAEIPRWIRLKLEALQDDKPALLDFGLDVVTRLGETLLKGGAPGLHFYTLNQAEPTLRLWKNLGLPVSHGPGTDS